MKHIVGCDLGSRRDYTALVALGIEERGSPPGTTYLGSARPRDEPAIYHVRHVERIPLGTPYPAIVERVGEFMAQPELKHREMRPLDPYRTYPGEWNPWVYRDPELVVDATGVGVAVTDMFKAAGVQHYRVVITGGDAETHPEYGEYRVPARDLISAPQVLLDTGRLLFPPDIPMRDVLTREMLNFRVKINPQTAHDSYAAWREGDHDDLVYALAMACWRAEKEHGPRHRRVQSGQARIVI